MAYDKVVDSSILDGYFDDIADAIRYKNGSQNTYTPIQMPSVIENIESPDSVTDCSYLFAYNTSRLTELVNTRIITNKVNNMFASNRNLTDADVNAMLADSRFTWYITDTNMQSFMFGCNSLTALDLQSITFGRGVFNLDSAFASCASLQSLIVPQVITNRISNLCSQCYQLQHADISRLNNVYVDASCSYAFSECRSLQSVVLPSLTNSYANITNLFSGCSNLSSITNLENFIKDTSNAETVFASCHSLTAIRLPNFKLSSVLGNIRLNYMFYDCINTHTIDLLWDCSNAQATNTNYMFNNCSGLRNLIIRWTGGVPTITSANTISSLPSTCNIYVPDSLVSQYKVATNWVTKASQIKPLSEYVEE